MKKFFVFLTTILFFGLFSTSLKADVVTSYNLDVNIRSDLSSEMNLTIDLQNTSDASLISGYSLELPYQVSAANATLDNNSVSIILDSQFDKSTIQVDFLTNVIKPGGRANLNLNLSSSNSVKELYKVKEFNLPYPSSNYSYSAINVSITYPVILGSISYSSESKYNLERISDDFSKISFQQTAPIKLLWGSPEFNAVFRSSITNRKDAENHFLFNLIPEYSDQSVDYIQIFSADYALVDKQKNNFAFITLPANGNSLLNSEASVRLNSANSNQDYSEIYNWDLNLDSVFGQKIYSNINQGTDNFSKFKSVNDFVFQNYSLNTQKIKLPELLSVWDSNKKDLNQLQYCYIIVSTAEYLGYKANIEYGYNLNGNSTMVNPSIWCNVQLDGKNLIFDFATQKAIGYPQIVTSSINKLRMGIWHPDQSYNDMLGLLSEEVVTVSFIEHSDNTNADLLEPELKIEFPTNVYSGEFYSGKIFIINPTSKLLTFNNLKVNNESVMSNLEVGQLSKAVMPLQQTGIKIDYLRENDFILNLSREITVEAEVGINKLNDSIEVRFEPDYKLIAIFFVILIITVSIFIYLVIKLIRRKV